MLFFEKNFLHPIDIPRNWCYTVTTSAISELFSNLKADYQLAVLTSDMKMKSVPQSKRAGSYSGLLRILTAGDGGSNPSLPCGLAADMWRNGNAPELQSDPIACLYFYFIAKEGFP